jgi:UDP-glucose 4-epimerase
MKKILITGVSGYIGSCVYLFLKEKFNIIGIDKSKNKLISTNYLNLLNKKKLYQFLQKERPDLVIHLAAQSLVDETINQKKYYENNVLATKNLITIMNKVNIKNLIFSSTAAVYKYSNNKLNEKSLINPKSEYAKTKHECEKIIKNSKLNSVILRFFNVCSSIRIKNKLIGELHNPETHLIPTIVYKILFRKKFYIYGDKYKTKDGTCIRDYIHVKDICVAINKSIAYLSKNPNSFEIINIGSNNKNTNLEILKKIKMNTQIEPRYEIVKNRKGDVGTLFCSINKAKKKLNWKPNFSEINNIIKDEILWVNYLKKNNIKRKFKNYL